MADREKLVIAIERAKEQSEEYGLDRILVDFKTVDMILELLKEQEAIEPDVYSEGTCMCGNCGMTVGYYPAGCSVPRKLSKYCSECGRKVKWE